MRPSVALNTKRHTVRDMVGRFRSTNPRIFGSVLHGTDGEGSDLDLLVDALPGATLLEATLWLPAEAAAAGTASGPAPQALVSVDPPRQ